MLDERVKTLHPKIHGGLLADPATSRTAPTSNSTASSRSTSSCRTSTRSRPTRHRDDRHRRTGDDARGREEPRVGHDRHRAPTQYGALLEELHANDGTVERRRRGARSRSKRSRAPPRTTPRSCSGCRTASSCRSTSCSRSTAPTRRCATARTRTSRRRAYRRHGTTSWWDGVEQHGGLALSYLNFYDADAAWKLVHDLGDRARRARSSSTRTRAASRSTTTSPTAYQRALECDERSAFGGIVALEPADRRRDGRAHGRGPAGRRRDRAGLRRGRDRGAAARSARTRGILEAPAPGRDGARLPPDLGRVPRAGRRTTSRRAATTGASSPRSRRPPSSGATSSSRGASAGT